jgi:tight adherence protein C
MLILAFLSTLILSSLAFEHWGNGLMARMEKPSEIPLEDLPDILEGLSLCAEAGMDLQLALGQLIEPRKTEPLAAELFTVVQEVKAGSTKAEAWRRLAERIDHEEIKLLVSLVLQSEALGTGLSRQLRSLAEGIRERRFRLAEKRALEAPVKLMLPMLCVFVAIFVIIGGALYLDISSSGGF